MLLVLFHSVVVCRLGIRRSATNRTLGKEIRIVRTQDCRSTFLQGPTRSRRILVVRLRRIQFPAILRRIASRHVLHSPEIRRRRTEDGIPLRLQANGKCTLLRQHAQGPDVTDAGSPGSPNLGGGAAGGHASRISLAPIAPGRPFGHNGGMKNRRQIIFEIETTSKLEEKLQRMHENPVRAGLVRLATDWKWGSARWYQWRRSVGVPIQSGRLTEPNLLWRSHPGSENRGHPRRTWATRGMLEFLEQGNLPGSA